MDKAINVYINRKIDKWININRHIDRMILDIDTRQYERKIKIER